MSAGLSIDLQMIQSLVAFTSDLVVQNAVMFLLFGLVGDVQVRTVGGLDGDDQALIIRCCVIFVVFLVPQWQLLEILISYVGIV